MYDISYNPVRKIWTIWKTCGMNSTMVKTFKTQAGAERWVAKHS